MTGSPSVTRNPSLGTAALNENALAAIRWQPVQWQAMVRSGGALILSRTCPQRHPPSRGRFRSLMIWFFRFRHHQAEQLPPSKGSSGFCAIGDRKPEKQHSGPVCSTGWIFATSRGASATLQPN